MSISEKILTAIAIIIAICLIGIIASGNVQIIIVVGDKLIGKAKEIDWRTANKVIGYFVH